MKSQSAVLSNRCSHLSASGRRCRLLAVPGSHSGLCHQHLAQLKRIDILDLKDALLTGHEGFQTAQGINRSLSNLYILLANNYISPRRASVLAFINSLQLRTLPAIDADLEAGITDPTISDENRDEETSSPDTSAADPVLTSPAAVSPEVDASQGEASTWDESIPEPDPNKKPS